MPNSLLGTSRASLALLLNQRGEPSYRGDQVFRWIHERQEADFSSMSDLPAALRAGPRLRLARRPPSLR